MTIASPVRRRRLRAAALTWALVLISCWKVDANLKLSTNKLDFGTSHDEETFTVTNDSKDNALTSGVTQLDYSVKSNRAWLTVTPVSGRLEGDQSNTHMVTIDRSALPDGESIATITATSNGGSDDITVHVMSGAGGGCGDPPTAPSDPDPTDGATAVGIDDDLSWSGGNSQCDGNTATYDVYFGTTNPPPFHHNSGEKKTFNPGRMAANTSFYWRILAKDNNGSTQGKIWSFHTASGTGACTNPLTTLSLSSPADGATGVSLDARLSWTGGDSQCDGHTSQFSVYFGTSSSPPLADTVTEKSFDPGHLDASTTYYWKVRASDGISSRTSVVRRFTTAAAACTSGPSSLHGFSPGDGDDSVALDQVLSWDGGDSQCPGQTATYDVYFGTSSPPPLAHNNGTNKSWDPGTLSQRQKYYWKIVAKDDKGTQSSGVMSFTTRCSDTTGASLSSPCDPSPPNGKDKVNPGTSISWGCGVTDCGEDVTYTFYLGKSPDLGSDDILTTTTSRSVKPSGLSGSTTYYWKVVAHAGSSDRSSPVWHFKTR
jgi:hypothetical protein